jgi:hypothetical protein
MVKLVKNLLDLKFLSVLLFIASLLTTVSGSALELLNTNESATKHPASHAFDGSAKQDDFWESSLNSPVAITWKQDQPIISYALLSGDSEPSRMPTAWILEGGDNAKHWVVLDKQENQSPWKMNEKRIYKLSHSASHLLYRLTFLKTSVPEGQDNILRIFEIIPNPETAKPISKSTSVNSEPFLLHPYGTLEWPGSLRISKSGEGSGLPPFEDGRTRAQPGGSLVIQPQGDLMRGAIDLLPTSGEIPDTGALGELTLHRKVPDADGYDMISFAALAREDLPFGMLLENHGKGGARPFIFMTMAEDKEFTQARYYEPLRITKEGTVQIGRKRGFGSTAKLENNDHTQVDSLFLEREDPRSAGQYSSDFFRITAKTLHDGKIHRYDWRMNVQLKKNRSSLVVSAPTKNSKATLHAAFHDNGTLELLTPGAGIILQSPKGNKWQISVNEEGELITKKSP